MSIPLCGAVVAALRTAVHLFEVWRGRGNGFFVCRYLFGILRLNARLAFKFPLQLTLGFGPLLLLPVLFLLAFGKSCAWSGGQWQSPWRRAAASSLN
jgi:hypothetical protein